MDASGLVFDLGETPFDNVSTIRFNNNGLSCVTWDKFVTMKPKVIADLFEMGVMLLQRYTY